MHVIGRSGERDGPAGRLGTYRARDGSDGAPVYLDMDRPHAGVVVGKRGSGKSYTLGVLAELGSSTTGVAPVVVDPMGVFGGLVESDDLGATARRPRVPTTALAPASWPDLFGLDPTGPVGSLLWQAAAATASLSAMRAHVADAPVDPSVRRGATNYLALAESWEVFDPDGVTAAALADGEVSVLDLSGLAAAPSNAVVRALASDLYEARVTEEINRLPWLLVDEAHVFFDGIAAPALRTLVTRGRAPGVSLVTATQRPGALPSVVLSQSDLLIAHRLTAGDDLDGLEVASPAYLSGSLRDRLPTETGAALVVDDGTESVHTVRVRARETPHDGASPRASGWSGAETIE